MARAGKRAATLAALACAAGGLTACTPVAGLHAAPSFAPSPIGLHTVTLPPRPSRSPRVVPTVTRVPLPEPKTVGPESTIFTTPTTKGLPPGCAPWQHQSKSNVPLDPTVEAGAATLSWLYSGDPDLILFRVVAVPEIVTGDASDTQAQLNWLDVPVDQPCKPVVMQTRVPGLKPGMDYTFWLTAHFRRRDGRQGFLDRQLGHSGSVRIR